jgi:hypothetical protein
MFKVNADIQTCSQPHLSLIPLTNKFYKELLPFESLTKYFLAEKSSMKCSKQEQHDLFETRAG